MIKLMFSLIIIICASLVGNTFSLRIINRKKTLSEIIKAISRMKTLICFEKTDVNDLIKNCFASEEFPLLDCTDLENGFTYGEAFKSCVSKISGKFSLTKSDKDLLTEFCVFLGSTDVVGQVAHIELYIRLFEERLELVREQANSKSKLYRVLGFSLGCAVSLMIV